MIGLPEKAAVGASPGPVGFSSLWHGTPVKALGATDQHSQLQLYLEGPNDKLVTVLGVSRFGAKVPLHAETIPHKGVRYLDEQDMGVLLNAERRATVDALVEAQRPVVAIQLPRVNAHTVGQLLFLFEVQTAMAGQLFGVDAFDQPGVDGHLQSHAVSSAQRAVRLEKQTLA